jgi:hypothetical protein
VPPDGRVTVLPPRDQCDGVELLAEQFDPISDQRCGEITEFGRREIFGEEPKRDDNNTHRQWVGDTP